MDDPFSAFLIALANGGTVAPSGQQKPLDIEATFSSLFNTGDNTPKPSSAIAPPTDAAGTAQGFAGITQGYEGLNTMPRPDAAEDDPFWSLLSVFT